MSDDFPRTRRFLAAEVSRGDFTRGVQVCVELSGERVLDLVDGDDGLGRAVDHETLFKTYCTTKPVTALAVANLVDKGTLDLDERLGPSRPCFAGYRALSASDITLRHVLTHTAGLHLVAGVGMEMLPPGRRLELLRYMPRPPNWKPGLAAGYSEYYGWHVLGLLLEDETGEPLREHLRRAVLDPLGMDETFIGMDAATYERNVDRIGVNFDLRDYFRPYLMLVERTPSSSCTTNCAYGGYTTARDLVRLYAALLTRLAGDGTANLPSPETLATFTSRARPAMFDAVLQRQCSFGLGFMTDLPDHAFGGEPSRRSFGHSGNVGSSFAFADPEYGLSVAVVFNGITGAEAAFVRRPQLVRALYRDLGLVEFGEAAAPDHDAGPRGARARRRRG